MRRALARRPFCSPYQRDLPAAGARARSRADARGRRAPRRCRPGAGRRVAAGRLSAAARHGTAISPSTAIPAAPVADDLPRLGERHGQLAALGRRVLPGRGRVGPAAVHPSGHDRAHGSFAAPESGRVRPLPVDRGGAEASGVRRHQDPHDRSASARPTCSCPRSSRSRTRRSRPWPSGSVPARRSSSASTPTGSGAGSQRASTSRPASPSTPTCARASRCRARRSPASRRSCAAVSRQRQTSDSPTCSAQSAGPGTQHLRHAVLPTTSPASDAFRPRTYWRGPSWPVMNWFFAWMLQRRGQSRARRPRFGRPRSPSSATAALAEYYEPLTGAPLGSHDQSWTAAAALDLLIHPDWPITSS